MDIQKKKIFVEKKFLNKFTMINSYERITPKIKDPINPNYYKHGEVECINAIESATINKNGIEAVCTANIIKYLWRYENKNGLEDVQKASYYLNYLIEVLKKKTN